MLLVVYLGQFIFLTKACNAYESVLPLNACSSDHLAWSFYFGYVNMLFSTSLSTSKAAVSLWLYAFIAVCLGLLCDALPTVNTLLCFPSAT